MSNIWIYFINHVHLSACLLWIHILKVGEYAHIFNQILSFPSCLQAPFTSTLLYHFQLYKAAKYVCAYFLNKLSMNMDKSYYAAAKCWCVEVQSKEIQYIKGREPVGDVMKNDSNTSLCWDVYEVIYFKSDVMVDIGKLVY